ncbi:hypothetical protein LSH36_468g02045 [Paralvinella palmiformis]|uniref:Uncharacterized protein n=1 Tax=Paralvinella palmiformis TaxID=53620 RepID=A0AAD9J9Q9_9ANNE|nr:hypothetical protein LSH36_468g02045 [Paralvinella palmiformis]
MNYIIFCNMTSSDRLNFCVIAICLVSVGAGTCPLSPLYPYGVSRGDLAMRDGDDEYITMDLDFSVDFYGNQYNKIYMVINGAVSFAPMTVSNPSYTPFDTPYIAPFWSDIILDNNKGAVFYRTVNLNEEQDVVRMVKADSDNYQEPMNPTLIMVFTWEEVHPLFKPAYLNNTFQVVVASDGNKTISIFNYGSINWYTSMVDAAVGFDKGNKIDNAEYPISRSYQMGNIADYSNVGIPGRIVTRIDGTVVLKELEEDTCLSCTIDRASGNIETFDGSEELDVHTPNWKYLLAKEYNRGSDKCRFMLRATTGPSGSISWVSFSVNSQLKRNFAFERMSLDSVEVRGRGAKRVINNFPYYESFEDNGILFIVIEKTYGGWILHSLTCPYYLVYKPLESSQQLKLYLSSYYEGDILGMCQNRNNDPEDDRHTCSVPPVLANGTNFVTVIGESCSCPKNNKRCNKAISRL